MRANQRTTTKQIILTPFLPPRQITNSPKPHVESNNVDGSGTVATISECEPSVKSPTKTRLPLSLRPSRTAVTARRIRRELKCGECSQVASVPRATLYVSPFPGNQSQNSVGTGHPQAHVVGTIDVGARQVGLEGDLAAGVEESTERIERLERVVGIRAGGGRSQAGDEMEIARRALPNPASVAGG